MSQMLKESKLYNFDFFYDKINIGDNMKCLNCGEKVRGNYKYCLNCGCENKWTLKRKILYFLSIFVTVYVVYAIGLTILVWFLSFIFLQSKNPLDLFIHLINPLNNTIDYNITHFITILIICFIVYFCTKITNSFLARKAKNKVILNNYNGNNAIPDNNKRYVRSQNTKEIGYTIIFLITIIYAICLITSCVGKSKINKMNEKESLDRVELYAEKLNSYLRDYHLKYGYDHDPSSYCDLNPENKPILLGIQCNIEYDEWRGIILKHCLVNNQTNKSYGYDGQNAYVEKNKQFANQKNECV